MKSLLFEEAVGILQKLDILIYPTETFFAVGGSAIDSLVVAKVYSAKARGKDLPLPVIIGDLSQLSMISTKPGPDVEMLISHFWPGPLTIIMPARQSIPTLLTAGTGRVAVRLSSHLEASRLAKAAGFPLVSSSANLSGQNPVTRAEDLDTNLIKAANGAVYTGGQTPAGGAPSTIVEICQAQCGGRILHILREGAIPASSFSELGFSCNIR